MWIRTRLSLARPQRRRWDRGMVTAEYAIGTLAAVAFALLLFKIATSPQMVADMANVFNRAFQLIGPSALTGGH